MKRLLSYYQTTIGKKTVMALTGLVLALFLVGHMTGNLKYFSGIDPETQLYKLDIYAKFLREVGGPLFGHGQLLWLARLILLVCTILHILSAFHLVLLNRRSRPVAYGQKENIVTSYAARTMWVSGILLLFFIIIHLLHFTTGTIRPQGFMHGHVYTNVTAAFHVWYWTAGYVTAMAILCSHLYHGMWSAFQTLGLANQEQYGILQIFSKLFAFTIFLGYISVPFAIFFGFGPST